MIIYKATNQFTGRVYIGQTKFSLETRVLGHLQSCRSGCLTRLYAAMRKYGEDAFHFEVVEEGIEDADILNERERYWIQQYDSYVEGYNSTLGGEDNPMNYPEGIANHLRAVRSPKFRKEHSLITKRLIAERGFSEQHRQRISESMRGNKNFSGKKLTEQHKAMLLEVRKKKVYCLDFAGNRNDFDSLKEAVAWCQQLPNCPQNLTYEYANNIKRSSKLNTPDKRLGLQWFYK